MKAIMDGRIKPTERDQFDPADYRQGPSMYTVTEPLGYGGLWLKKNWGDILTDIFLVGVGTATSLASRGWNFGAVSTLRIAEY